MVTKYLVIEYLSALKNLTPGRWSVLDELLIKGTIRLWLFGTK